MTIADKNRAGLMGPEQAKKLDKAITTDTGQVLTSPTINGGALSGTFSGAHTYSGVVTVTGGALNVQAAGGNVIELGRIDGSSSTPAIDFHSGATAVDYDARLIASGGTGSNGGGVLNIQCAQFQFNSSDIMTRGATETITGLKTISVGNSTANTSFLNILPNDYASSKPGLFFTKSSAAAKWSIDLWDGSANTGTINFSSGTLTHNDVALARVDGPVFTLPPRLPSYTVATLPSAATYVRGLIYVSDGTSNKRQAVSDGTNWRWPDGAIVS